MTWYGNQDRPTYKNVGINALSFGKFLLPVISVCLVMFLNLAPNDRCMSKFTMREVIFQATTQIIYSQNRTQKASLIFMITFCINTFYV